MNNIDKIPCKFLVNTLLKPKKNSFHFLELLHKKERANSTKKLFTTKHRMFGATNLRQPRKFYTIAGCNG